jgi:hypothetical protein
LEKALTITIIKFPFFPRINKKLRLLNKISVWVRQKPFISVVIVPQNFPNGSENVQIATLTTLWLSRILLLLSGIYLVGVGWEIGTLLRVMVNLILNQLKLDHL